MTGTTIILSNNDMVSEGLDYILSHFEDDTDSVSIWPRTNRRIQMIHRTDLCSKLTTLNQLRCRLE
jgi:hypothetical protein